MTNICDTCTITINIDNNKIYCSWNWAKFNFCSDNCKQLYLIEKCCNACQKPTQRKSNDTLLCKDGEQFPSCQECFNNIYVCGLCDLEKVASYDRPCIGVDYRYLDDIDFKFNFESNILRCCPECVGNIDTRIIGREHRLVQKQYIEINDRYYGYGVLMGVLKLFDIVQNYDQQLN